VCEELNEGEEWYRDGRGGGGGGGGGAVVGSACLLFDGRLGADFRSLPTTLNAGKSFEEHGLFRPPKSAGFSIIIIILRTGLFPYEMIWASIKSGLLYGSD
jgi:hypothetical protein